MNDRLTDTRPAVIVIDELVLMNYDLTPYEGWVYIAILKHANHKTNEAFPGIARLADITKMSKSQVMRSIATLETKKLIKVERDNKPIEGEKRKREVNHYFILPASSSVQQEVGVVSDRKYSSVQQEVGVVSDRDKNLYPSKPNKINQKKSTPKLKPEEIFRQEWEAYSTIGMALLKEFACDFVPVENQTVSSLTPYLEVAKELTSVNATIEQIPLLGKYIAKRAKDEEWSKYGVKTYARYYTDFLKQAKPVSSYDGSENDLSRKPDITPILMQKETA